MIRVTNQYIWNIVFLIFFLVLVVMGIIILDTEAYKSYEKLELLDFVLIAFASYRLMHFFAYDGITKFFREQFYDAKVTKAGKVTLYKPTGGPRRTLLDLFNCPWCFGLWNTALITFVYLLYPAAYFVILVLAIAAVVSVLHAIIENFNRRE